MDKFATFFFLLESTSIDKYGEFLKFKQNSKIFRYVKISMMRYFYFIFFILLLFREVQNKTKKRGRKHLIIAPKFHFEIMLIAVK